MHEEGSNADKDDSLGGNEEVSRSVNDGNSLHELGPVAPKHNVEKQADNNKRCSTDEHSISGIFISLMEALIETKSSTNNIDELHDDNCGISDGSWVSAHQIHVSEGIDHCKKEANDDIEP